jgi:hypothetical protein
MSSTRFVLGTICKTKIAGARSLTLYNRLKGKHPFLLCPCSIPNIKVVFQDYVTANGAFVSLYDDPKKLSVIDISDLTPLHK